MAQTPTSRSLALLREEGWRATKVEYWCHFSKRRKDLFNLIDLLGIRDGETIGIQATTSSNVSARLKKALSSDNLLPWLRAGNRYEVWGWAKRGKLKRWTCKKKVLYEDDLGVARHAEGDQGQPPSLDVQATEEEDGLVCQPGDSAPGETH